MSRDDLLNMLDLEGGGPTESAPIPIAEHGADHAAPVSPTALKLGRWEIRKGEELAAQSDVVRKAIGLTDHGPAALGPGPSLGSDAGVAATVADLHAVAFEPDPTLAGRCVDPRRREFVGQLLDTAECQGLRASTVLNEAASELATAAFARQFAALVQQEADNPPGDGPEGEMRVLKAVGKALSGAARDVDDLNNALDALGKGPETPGSTMDPKAVAALFRRIRNNETLRKICERAGRFRRVAQSRQRRKADHGLDDLVGVEMGDDVGRLLPSELALLAIPELEDDVLRRFVERQLLCRSYRAVEPVGKGPIVLVVDESGSMHGEPVCDAKAIALALAYVARKQNRWCALVAFSGGTGGRCLALPPGKWDEVALVDWLGAFIGGGTDLDVPLAELPNRYWGELKCPRGKTDVVIITDAICNAPDQMIDGFNAWKAREQVRCISLIIRGRPGDLERVSEECHVIPSLSADQEAVGRVLAI